MDTLKEPTLELAIEIEPYSYSDRESPMMSPGQVNDDAFENYLSDCLKDAGLDHLVPVAASSMLYAIHGIDRDSLSTIVKNELSRWPEDEDYSDAKNVAEYGSSFSGGIVVLDRGECVTVPGCCCGLDCMKEWNQMLEDKPIDWSNLWTGHDVDSMEMRFQQSEQAFQFRLGKWETGEWDRQFTLTSLSFQEVIERLGQQATRLAAMIGEVLDSRFADQKCRSVIAQRIAGLT
jgi:hypothetical protein